MTLHASGGGLRVSSLMLRDPDLMVGRVLLCRVHPPRLVTLFFSHPAVHGIFWWGWWDSRHWMGNAGTYR
jgi:hypothetical protein